MRRLDRFICLLFIPILFSACNGTIAAESGPPVTSISTNTFLPPLSDKLPPDGLVLAAHVEAGTTTCYDLAIYQDGHYLILSCLPDFTYPTSTGFLDEYKLAYLQQWLERFQSFEDPLPQDSLKFTGIGSTIPDFSDRTSMRALISDIEWEAHGYVHKGGMPSAVFHARSVLSHQLGVPLDNNSILKFESVEFSDTCLGVPKPDETCSPVATQGFRIQLVAQGRLYEFHTDTFGYEIRQFGKPQIAPTPAPAG